jgi:branched-chain amino acid aminotransferase
MPCTTGSGVFEGIRAYATERGPAVWHLDEHLKRLFRSAKLYHMDIPYSVEAITDAVREVIRANGSTPATSARSSFAATARWA